MTDKIFPELLNEKAVKLHGYDNFESALTCRNQKDIIEIITAAAEDFAKQAFDAAKEGGVKRIPVVIDQYGSTNIEEHFIADKYPTFQDFLQQFKTPTP